MAASQLGSMNAFDPDTDDWTAYVERLESFFVTNDIKDEKKVSILVTFLGAKAYELLRTIIAPVKPADQSYNDLVKAMQNHLDPKPLTITERFKFHQRNQKEGETIAQYLAELRKLSQHCEFGDKLDETLRDRLVCGVHSGQIQKRLLAEKELTLQKAIELAQGMEAATKQSSELRMPGGTVPGSHEIHLQTAAGKPCYRCGNRGHPQEKCHFRTQKWNNCGKKGHIAKVCKASQKPGDKKVPAYNPKVKVPKTNNFVEQTETEEFGMFTVKKQSDGGIIIKLFIDRTPVKMTLDTGAAVSVISSEMCQELLPHLNLRQSKLLLKTYTGEPLSLEGEANVHISYQGQQVTLPLVVVAGSGPALLGRNWLQHIKLHWKEIKYVTTTVDGLLHKYQALFNDELGTMTGVQARLSVKPDSTPKFCRARATPYALREAIEKDLTRLQQMGVIESVKYSDWATPVVPVPKPDGTVRLCGDFKVTVNPVLQIDKYPIPKPEDLLTVLAGGQKFSKLDLSQAYQQMLLHPDDRKYTTINTHLGLFQYTRLPFGIASVPAIFQHQMEKILQGIPNIACYLDDVLITGKNNTEHVATLEKVFDRLYQWGLRLKRTKCEFLKESVQYLGYVVDAQGLHTAPDKIQAITDAPSPKTQQQLRAFLGLVNYYGKFLPSLSTTTHPLNQLLRHNVKWVWSKSCESSFQKLKSQLSAKPVLVHYDSTLPLKLACDASPYGVGAVISHVMPTGEEKPIAFGSRTLSKAERNYAQVEKEALAIIFGIKKFHQYIYGRKFLLVTDHKPLTTILSPKAGLPALAAARLQRWAIILSAYNYDIVFRPTKSRAKADCLSRLPLDNVSSPATDDSASLFNVQQIGTLPVTPQQLRAETVKDPLLSKVLRYTKDGWPHKISEDLHPFYRRRLELTIECGCLMWGIKVIVPYKLQGRVLEELHTGHIGIVKMKSLARTHVWWPSVDKQIEEIVQKCEPCQSLRNRPAPSTLHPWTWPSRPWQRLHVDFAGPFMDRSYLIVVDAHSKWPEVIPMMTTTADKTIVEL